MRTISATEASRRFSGLLDAIEAGESVTVTRGSKAIAEIRPARRRTGRALRMALAGIPGPDDRFVADVERTCSAWALASTRRPVLVACGSPLLPTRDERELGYVIGDRSRWGQGLGLAAASAACVHGFEARRRTAVTAEVAATNARDVLPDCRLLRLQRHPRDV